ncbi:secreted protein of porin family [Luminiphilus syltensis NOR5-1B]|uniref:Secreted protein of porin family n=2 Tax=Luminiphilus TaxID=1341118 RepID=B8KRZ1_9GAMM|nr:secreted protein of porin family [Luminiphilus syltensis NOR5-1B]
MAYADDATEQRIAQLERQVALLLSKLEQHEASVEVSTEFLDVNEARTMHEEMRPMSPNTKFTYGGFISLNALATNYSDGKPASPLIDDLLVPSLIPTGGDSSYSTTNIHAKQSRFLFGTETKTDAGVFSSRVELDFMIGGQGDERISNSYAARIRQAYVDWNYGSGSLLAGQAWSTFHDVSTLPYFVDFVGPAGTVFNRQAMVRWSTGNWQFAAENPRTRLNGVAHDDFNSSYMPDLVARYKTKTGNMNWSVAGILRTLSYDDRNTGMDDSAQGYGISGSGKYTLEGGHDIRMQLSYGDALGRYLGLNMFNDGYVDINGDVETFDQMGGYLAYRHLWSQAWESSIGYSYSAADNPSDVDSSSWAKEYHSFHANLKYKPAPGLWIGGEYIYASKELENGDKGDLDRIQMAVQYSFK